MKTTRLQNIMIRAAVLGAIIAGSAGIASAQKAKPAGPPVVTKGSTQSNPKADKGQATAQAARTEAREEKGERLALKNARQESKDGLKGIKLTEAQKDATKAIAKRYEDQYKELSKSEKTGDKAGTEDAAIVAKIDALRLQERAELRAALTPEQQIEFDKNLVAKVAKKN
jgi:Spy/CpxP family protein refolding chaperone